ncbi:hypothetical protein CEXT_183251 [Caerostris extrusa]|uniref:Uncharacterized protein n=1 Tax=Caerostris extrusa TaxID=172846 RepID=A0AAV4NSB0_CAEEX|nr:hypothetical protein CEXT_183251 [Caerostris extrusa]
MSLAGRCYFLEEAAGSSGDDDRRNVHHIILMLQSGRAGRRCHLLGERNGQHILSQYSFYDKSRQSMVKRFLLVHEIFLVFLKMKTQEQ